MHRPTIADVDETIGGKGSLVGLCIHPPIPRLGFGKFTHSISYIGEGRKLTLQLPDQVQHLCKSRRNEMSQKKEALKPGLHKSLATSKDELKCINGFLVRHFAPSALSDRSLDLLGM